MGETQDLTFLSQATFPGLFDHFVITWELKLLNLICKIIDFLRTCDPCCYCVLLLRPQVWIIRFATPSLSRNRYLGCVLSVLQTGAQLGASGALAPGTSPRLEVALLAACFRGQQPESEFLLQLCPVYLERGTAGNHEVSEVTARKF